VPHGVGQPRFERTRDPSWVGRCSPAMIARVSEWQARNPLFPFEKRAFSGRN
jgi:hypothetical protein